MSEMGPNWFKLAPNGTNLGHFKSHIFSHLGPIGCSCEKPACHTSQDVTLMKPQDVTSSSVRGEKRRGSLFVDMHSKGEKFIRESVVMREGKRDIE